MIGLRGGVYKPPPIGGAIAQLGERLNGIQEVVGSIPIGSTMNRQHDTAGEVTMIRLASYLIVLAVLAGCATTPSISTPPDDLQHAKPGNAGAY